MSHFTETDQPPTKEGWRWMIITSADFFVTNDRNLALDAYKEKRTQAKIEQLKKAA